MFNKIVIGCVLGLTTNVAKNKYKSVKQVNKRNILNKASKSKGLILK